MRSLAKPHTNEGRPGPRGYFYTCASLSLSLSAAASLPSDRPSQVGMSEPAVVSKHQLQVGVEAVRNSDSQSANNLFTA